MDNAGSQIQKHKTDLIIPACVHNNYFKDVCIKPKKVPTWKLWRSISESQGASLQEMTDSSTEKEECFWARLVQDEYPLQG